MNIDQIDIFGAVTPSSHYVDLSSNIIAHFIRRGTYVIATSQHKNFHFVGHFCTFGISKVDIGTDD